MFPEVLVSISKFNNFTEYYRNTDILDIVTIGSKALLCGSVEHFTAVLLRTSSLCTLQIVMMSVIHYRKLIFLNVFVFVM